MFETMIDPTGGPAPLSTEPGALAPRPADLSGLRLGVLANTKRNAAELLDAAAGGLGELYGTVLSVRHTKPHINDPVPRHMLDDLVAGCDVVVVGVGDCGSCSASGSRRAPRSRSRTGSPPS